MFFLQLIKKNIPNFLTLCNLLLGLFSIVASVEGYPVWAGVFIIIAAIFDFLDGLAARLLHAYSAIGKQLDSLADLVSFGIAPAFIIFSLLKSVLLISHIEHDDFTISNVFVLSVPFILVLFSALRLARFNVDERQTTEFIGLPTPANALFFAWLPIILSNYNMFAFFIILNIKTLVIITLLHSILMVSPFPFFSLKIKSLKWSDNQWRYVFLLLCIVMIVFFNVYSVPIIIWTYILFAIIKYLKKIMYSSAKSDC
ncbi:MAG: CDP-alcohol phosphatidyltransferase family protein [Bacteroidales bacterium]|nr:CDP-alcohol phosphatidyltransferase family protein [Bacteroidales bacterium]